MPRPRKGRFLLWEIRPGCCHYPVGNASETAPQLFCGAVIKYPLKSYCEEHAALCYKAPKPKPRRANHD
jgi:hypothetical protein